MAGCLKETGSRRISIFCAKIVVSNIPPEVKGEELVSFLTSGKLRCAVHDYQELPSRNGAAVLTLAAPVDVGALQEFCKSNPLRKQVLQIEAAQGLEDANSSGAHATSGAQSAHVTTLAASSHVCLEALVSDIPPTVTDDHLTNLLECATDDCDVKNVRRGTKEGVAVVVFEKPVDTEEIQSYCNENPEDGNVLRVEPVPNTGAVLIRNPPPEITTSSFKYYLSNTKRSGGNKGVTIDRDAHNQYLVASFDSKDVAKRVAEKQHTLESHALQLEWFDLDLNILPCPDGRSVDVTSTSRPVAQGPTSSCVAAADFAPPNQESSHSFVRGNDVNLDITRGLERINLYERVEQSSVVHQTIDLNSKQRYFLNNFCSTEIESLQRGTGLKYACIEIKGNVCKIQGYCAGVTKAEKRLRDIIKKICCRRAIFTHPNLASLLQSRKEMWDPMVGRVSQENCCIITELPDPGFQDADNDNDEWGQWSATVINSFPLPGGQVILHVTDGNAEDLKVDAAVLCYNGQSVQSSTNRQKPQPTQAFVQNTGARPKNHGNSSKDGHQLSDQPRGINVTQSGALPCKAVIHVDLSHYFSERSSAAFDSALQALMTDIFQECDRHHFSSLALPVFGVDVRASHDPQPIGEATTVIAMCCCNALAFEGSPRDVFLCSGRAACLHGLTFALEDQHGPALPKLSPFPETFQRLTCQPRGNRHTALNMDAISVSLGDISSVDADVLIVPLDIDIGLDLDESKVTRSLSMSGGESVQFSIQHRTTSCLWTVKCIDDNNEELADHHLLVGNPGYLNAKHIFYVYIPPWGPGVIKMLRERVQKCLRKAAEKGCKTVAMTALGVGKLGYPVEFAARTSIAAVADFMDQGKASLENVNFVMLPSDRCTLQAFRAEQSKWQLQRVCTKGGQKQPQNANQPTVNRHSYYTEPRRRGRENNLGPRTPAWETVLQRGYRLDPTRHDAVSLFIFSDSEERRQAAVEEIATGVVRLLGPGETEEPRKKVAGEGRKRGDDGQGDHSGGSFYSWEWGLGSSHANTRRGKGMRGSWQKQ